MCSIEQSELLLLQSFLHDLVAMAERPSKLLFHVKCWYLNWSITSTDPSSLSNMASIEWRTDFFFLRLLSRSLIMLTNFLIKSFAL